MRRSDQNPSSRETEDMSRRPNRRRALALGGAAAAAAAVAALGVNRGKTAKAQPGTPVFMGQPNDSGTEGTYLSGEVKGVSPPDDDSVLHIENRARPPLGSDEAIKGLDVSAYGSAVVGRTTGLGQESVGVQGMSGGSGPGVKGESQSGPGTTGQSVSGPGVHGFSDNGPGMRGESMSGPGLHGRSWDLIGVAGSSVNGPGVFGIAPSDRAGVVACSGAAPPGGPIADGGLALDVIGKARFYTAGAGVVPAKKRRAVVSNPAATPDSHVTVTLTGNPGPASVAWVQRKLGKFTIHMSEKVPARLPFTYLIVEPGA